MTTEPQESFAQLLLQARKRAGLTQEALAELAGISPRSVSSLERGINRAPRRDTLEMLFDALELTTEERVQWERTRRRLSTRTYPKSGIKHPDRPHTIRLPSPLTSFVGREEELQEVQQILSESRLVTITGPGGAGKTRLGIGLAEADHHSYPDGVFFVSLAAIERPDLVVSAVIRALELDENGEQSPHEVLRGYLRERSLLLVFDNFEHVIAAAPLVSELLRDCPHLKALVSSRVPLRISGEHEYPLRSLSEASSTILFVERTQQMRPEFQPDDSQIAAIAEICRRLDGLPLAIELAAARGRTLSPGALLARLEHPLSILAEGPRDVPARQRTLRDTITWSYDLLEPEHQTLFQALAVFRDGWSLEAAEAIGPEQTNVLEGVDTLVESSLIALHTETGEEPRFRMLETIREFGIELLESTGSEDTVREQHARYMASLVHSAPPFLRGPDQVYWLDRLEQEHANIRLALDWHLAHDVEAGLQMAAALWRFWWMRSHLIIGRGYFDQLLDRADDSIQPATLAAALTGAAVITLYESDLARDRAKELHEQALSIWLDLRDPPEGAYWSYFGLGINESRRGNLLGAAARFREALEYSQRRGHQYGILGGHLLLGNQAAWKGDLELAKGHFQAALSIAHELRDPWTIAMNAGNLATILAQQDRYDEALPLATEGLSLSLQLRHSRDVSWALDGLAEIELRRGRLPEARAYFDQALEYAHKASDSRRLGGARLGLGKIALLYDEVEEALESFSQALDTCLKAGSLPCIAESIEGLANANARSGNPKTALQLHAAMIAFCERVGVAAPGAGRSALEHQYVTAQQALTRTEFEEAWQAGCRLNPDQIQTLT